MRALTYAAFGGPLTLADLPDPVAPPGGAVVRVAASGLCRSDWHGWQGHDSDIVAFPHVPGHELAGTVESVGPGVDPAWVGRAVTCPFVLACGDCDVCRAGDGQVCPRQRQPGFSDPGSFAELVVVHAAPVNLVAIPDGLAATTAAGLGCRIATAYRAVRARARVREGETVVVLGSGGLGLAAVLVAAAQGARVVAVDRSPESLARARAVGAAETVVSDDGLVDALADLTGGGGHVSLDCVGSPQTCRDGVLALRRRGRFVQVGLLPPAAGRPLVPMERVIAWELDLLGSHGMAAADYPPMLDDVACGRLDVAALLAPGEPIGLEEAARALPAMGASASTGIVLVDPARS